MTRPLDPDLFDPVCPSDLSPIRVGDKWAGMIIRCLEHGPRRFSELRIPLRGITAKVLTQALRTLERDVAVACAWAQQHWDELLDAREAAAPRNRA